MQLEVADLGHMTLSCAWVTTFSGRVDLQCVPRFAISGVFIIALAADFDFEVFACVDAVFW